MTASMIDSNVKVEREISKQHITEQELCFAVNLLIIGPI